MVLTWLFIQVGFVTVAQQPGVVSVIYGLDWSPDGTMIAVGRSMSVEILDGETRSIIMTLRGTDGAVVSVDWSPDGTKLVAGISASYTGAPVWDFHTGQIIAREPPGPSSSWVKWNPDSIRVTSSGFDNSIAIWDGTTGQSLGYAPVGGGMVNWSPDGNKLVTNGDNIETNWASVGDIITGTATMKLVGHSSWLTDVEWSPDGSKIATGSNDETARIWDAETGKTLLVLRGHRQYISAVSWSPDSRVLASASDNTILFWDAQTGQVLRTVQADGEINIIAWRPDGKKMAYGGTSGMVQVIDTTDVLPVPESRSSQALMNWLLELYRLFVP